MEKYYYFARLNLVGSYTNKEIFLLNSLSSHYYYPNNKYEWGFINVERIEFETRILFCGKLVKFIDDVEEEVVNKDHKEKNSVNVQNKIIAEANFILDCKTGIMAYNEVSGKIGYKQFIENFAAIIERALPDNLVQAEIKFILDQTDFFMSLYSLDRVKKVKISLHPSNPNSRHLWKDTDERMQHMKAQKYKQTFESNEGLQIEEDIKLKGDLIMSIDGYGSSEVEGVKDNKVISISTKESPIKQKGIVDGDKKDIIRSVWNKFEVVFKRMSN